MTTAKPSSVLIVGDSIALGATEVLGSEVVRRAPQSFVDRLRSDQPAREIFVDAAVRRTTGDALASLPALLVRYRPAIALLAMGGNDADIDWRRYLASGGRRLRHNVPVEAFETNLRAFVDAARGFGAVPLLSDLPSGDLAGRGRWLSANSRGIDASAMIEASGGEAESARRLAPYSEAIERLAAREGVAVVRWAAALASVPPAERYGPDALHPGDAAHAVIADVVGRALAACDGRVVAVPRAAAS